MHRHAMVADRNNTCLPSPTHECRGGMQGGSKISAELVEAFTSRLHRECSKENRQQQQQQRQQQPPPNKWSVKSWDE